MRRSAAARTRLAEALTEKFSEKRAGFLPVFPVDAIFYFWGLHFALYEPGFFQLFQVLRYRSFGNGQFFVYLAEVAARLMKNITKNMKKEILVKKIVKNLQKKTQKKK